jgi:hypothetical protein
MDTNNPEKVHIEQINAKYRNDTTQNYKHLNNFISGQNQNVINELVQNANDAFSKQKVNIQIQVRQQDDTSKTSCFLFSHTGKPFDKHDVETLCELSHTANQKIRDRTKIGFKGSGFKSVFNCSTRVFVVSGGYNFYFEKDQTPNNNSRPWMLFTIYFLLFTFLLFYFVTLLLCYSLLCYYLLPFLL